MVWKSLSNTDIEPCKWGWQILENQFCPIMTDCDPGPPNLLKIVRCSCKKSCKNNCSCIKAGLHCTTHCKNCFENDCTNVEKINDEDNDDGLSNAYDLLKSA